jgi:hypothetical protein
MAYLIAFVTSLRFTVELRRAVLMVRNFGSAMVEILPRTFKHLSVPCQFSALHSLP